MQGSEMEILQFQMFWWTNWFLVDIMKVRYCLVLLGYQYNFTNLV